MDVMRRELSPCQLSAALEVCGSFNLRRAARVVTQFYDEMLESSGLRSTQFVVLATIALAQEAGITRLARDLSMDTSTLTRNLKPLERRGLVNISVGGDNRRRLVSLTAEGERVLGECMPVWQQAQEIFEGNVGEEAWSAISRNLQVAIKKLRDTSRVG